MIMIHNLQIEDMSGTQKEIEEESKRLKKLGNDIVNLVARHTGQPLRKVRRDCEKDKYFTPEEAIKYGIIDGIMSANKPIPELNTKKKA